MQILFYFLKKENAHISESRVMGILGSEMALLGGSGSDFGLTGGLNLPLITGIGESFRLGSSRNRDCK